MRDVTPLLGLPRPLSAADLAAINEALEMIDPYRWSTRLVIVREVLRHMQHHEDDCSIRCGELGWAEISPAGIARRNGKEPRHYVHLMGDGASTKNGALPGALWRVEWVIQRGVEPAGRRPRSFRVNPKVDQWRNVPWLVDDPEMRRLRIRDARRAPARATETSVVARAVAQERGLVARAVAQLAPAVAALLREENPDLDDFRALSDATARATTTDSPLSREVRDGTSDPTKPLSQAERARVDTIIGAIRARTSAPVNKTLAGELCELLAGRDFDVDHLVHAVDNAPYGLGPPMIIRDYLPAVLKGDLSVIRLADLDAMPTGYPAARCEMELAGIDQAIANWRAEGAEPPPSLIEDRERWQTELDHSRRSRRA